MADEERWYTVTWSAQVWAANPVQAMTNARAVTTVAAYVHEGPITGPVVRPGQHCASCDGHSCPDVG